MSRAVKIGTVGAVVATFALGLSTGPVPGPAPGAGASPPPSGPVKVAVEGPMSGPQRATGRDMVRGARLAARSINASGGVLGRPVQIVVADDAGSAKRGAAVARRMVGRGVAAVIGPFNSAVGLTALPVYRRAGTAILRITSAADTERFGVTTQPMVTQIAPVEAFELINVLKAHSVAILYDPSTYTAGIAKELQMLLHQSGAVVPLDRSLSPGTGPAQVASAVAQVNAARPDVTYLAMYGPEAGAVAKTLATGASGPSASGPVRCLVDLAAQGPAFGAAAGSAASSCLASGVPAAAQLPGGTSYVASYRAAFHRAPGTWGPFVFDALELWAASAKRAHQVFGPGVRRALFIPTGINGVTGMVTIAHGTGNRVNPPVVILDVSPNGSYRIDKAWVKVSGYGAPPPKVHATL